MNTRSKHEIKKESQKNKQKTKISNYQATKEIFIRTNQFHNNPKKGKKMIQVQKVNLFLRQHKEIWIRLKLH